jgi:hypothetical protein
LRIQRDGREILQKDLFYTAEEHDPLAPAFLSLCFSQKSIDFPTGITG